MFHRLKNNYRYSTCGTFIVSITQVFYTRLQPFEASSFFHAFNCPGFPASIMKVFEVSISDRFRKSRCSIVQTCSVSISGFSSFPAFIVFGFKVSISQSRTPQSFQSPTRALEVSNCRTGFTFNPSNSQLEPVNSRNGSKHLEMVELSNSKTAHHHRHDNHHRCYDDDDYHYHYHYHYHHHYHYPTTTPPPPPAAAAVS